MSKGRKPAAETLPANVQMNEDAVRNDMIAADQLIAIKAVAPEIASLGRMVGQFETVHFYQTVGDSLKLAAFDSAKNQRLTVLINPKPKTHMGFG